jgi:hypothetical protein
LPTIAQHIAARDDTNLHARLIAAAEMTGVPGPTQWVAENVGALVNADIDGTTLADVHAYAVTQQEPPPLPPGANPTYVTDAQLIAAVQAIRT